MVKLNYTNSDCHMLLIGMIQQEVVYDRNLYEGGARSFSANGVFACLSGDLYEMFRDMIIE